MNKVLLLALSLIICAQARILLIVDRDFYTEEDIYGEMVDTYANDIATIDKNPTEVILWDNRAGTVRDQCYPLWQLLTDKYAAHYHNPKTSDNVEGAIFIGNIPVPQFRHLLDSSFSINNSVTPPDTVINYAYHDFPHDTYFMDIWDQRGDSSYCLDTLLWRYVDSMGLFTNNLTDVNSERSGYKERYGYYVGDTKLDIWISRMSGEFCQIPTKNLREYTIGEWVPEYRVTYNALERAHKRMTEPSKVPPRSFSMSGITAWGGTDPDSILYLDTLGLPEHIKFRHPDNTPANFQAQLQAGPRGNINYGGHVDFNELEHYQRNEIKFFNTKNCIRNTVLNDFTGSMIPTDTLGYTIAGYFEHGSPLSIGFNGAHYAGSGRFNDLNGHFMSYAISPPLYTTVSGGYGGDYYKFDTRNQPDMWGWDWSWNDQTAYWKMAPVSGDNNQYSVYMHYIANPDNRTHVTVNVCQRPENNHAQAYGGVKVLYSFDIDQRTHLNEEVPGNNWELLGPVTLDANFDSIQVQVEINGNAAAGSFVLDAVKLVGTPGTPSAGRTYSCDNSEEGFVLTPGPNRSFIEMYGDGGPSKVPFFVSNSCKINCYNHMTGNSYNCLGNLYAMHYEGLVSIGAINNNFASRDYKTLMLALKAGKSFGQAYLEYTQNWSTNPLVAGPEYVILGAGNLKLDYIKYGTVVVSNLNVGPINPVAINQPNPVLINNSVVSTEGSLSASSTHDITIAPETSFIFGSDVHLQLP